MARLLPRLGVTALLFLPGCFRAVEPAANQMVDELVQQWGELTGSGDGESAEGSGDEDEPDTDGVLAAAPAPAGDDAPAPAPIARGGRRPEVTAGTLPATALLPVADALTPAAGWDAGIEPGSLKLTAEATVYAEPDASSTALGLIAPGVRLAVRERVVAAGCPQAWIGVAPMGYVCAEFSESDKAPEGELLPHLPAGKRVPGTYGRVAQGSRVYPTLAQAKAGIGGSVPDRKLTVRRAQSVTTGGASFWQTKHGWVASKDIRKFSGSSFSGVELTAADAPALPFAWVMPEALLAKVPLKESTKAGAKAIRMLERREIVELESTELVKGHFAVKGGGFIEKARLAVVDASSRPEIAADGERWLDIDLSEQTLVAYEGDAPVYATMISAGKPGHSTPTGVFRISRKVAERTMNSTADSDELYSVARVPWTAYFATGYALHAAYWHDNFGHRKSHGCVNLSPLDARALYAWTAPLVAPGWSEVYGHEEQPGSVIRIRSHKNPDPEVRGYAKDIAADGKLAMR